MANWVAAAFKYAQTDFKLGSDIMNITADYLSSKAKESGLKAQVKNFKNQETDLIKTAGKIQRVGRQQREARLVQLGQEVGYIRAGAAGSGIDVSSRTVKKTISDTVKSAYNDAYVSAQNEYENAQDAINKAQSANESAIWSEYARKQEKNNRKWSVFSGALSAAANWVGGVAEATATGFGG